MSLPFAVAFLNLGFPGNRNQGPQVVDDPGLKEDEGEHTEEDKEASS